MENGLRPVKPKLKSEAFGASRASYGIWTLLLKLRTARNPIECCTWWTRAMYMNTCVRSFQTSFFLRLFACMHACVSANPGSRKSQRPSTGVSDLVANKSKIIYRDLNHP